MSQTQHARSQRLGPSIQLSGPLGQGWFGTPPPIPVDAVQVLIRPVVEGRAPPPGVERWLSDDERARAARFVKDADGWRFIEAHALLRFLLGHHLGMQPARVEFVLSPHGKPRQSCPASARVLAFNLSHTVGLLAVALAGAGQRVGVDVEKCGSRVDALEIARTHFSPRESAYLNELPGAAQADAFRQLWTRKEALHKADGRGLSLPLDTFNTLDPCCGGWVVTDLALPAGHVGAVACMARGEPLAIDTHLL